MTETLPHATHTAGRDDPEKVSVAVVRAVAEEKGVSPLNVEPTLGTVIDPSALDELVESMAGGAGEDDGFVTFAWCGYDVAVSGDGFVTVTER